MFSCEYNAYQMIKIFCLFFTASLTKIVIFRYYNYEIPTSALNYDTSFRPAQNQVMKEVLFHFSLLAYPIKRLQNINYIIIVPLVNKIHLLMVQLLPE